MKSESDHDPGERVRAAQKALGSRIRDLRREKGWSQREFAAVCGSHHSYVGQVERGESNLTLSTLALFARKLNTTISAIFRGVA